MPTTPPDSAASPLPYTLPLCVCVTLQGHEHIRDADNSHVADCAYTGQAAALVTAANAAPQLAAALEALQQIALIADTAMPKMGRFEAAKPLMAEILAKARAALTADGKAGQ